MTTTVSRFRRFGRPPAGPPDEPDPWLDDPPPPPARPAAGPAPQAPPAPPARPAGPRTGPADPATRAARPALWTPRRPAPPSGEPDDPSPVTDPFGFPPVPPVAGAAADPLGWAAWAPAGDPPPPGNGGSAEPPKPASAVPTAPSDPAAASAGPPIDPAEAGALAGAFAADYLSWDEDDPARRGQALAEYLPGPRTDRALLGWSGRGRQRCDLVLVGRTRPDRGGVLVDVRARVTPYRRVDNRAGAQPDTEPADLLGTPAAAPAATARGWRGMAARWIRLGVAVAREGEHLVVDAGDGAPGADEPPAAAEQPATPALSPEPAPDGGVPEPRRPRSVAAAWRWTADGAR